MNVLLRERIDRLRELHQQLHTLTTQAFDELLNTARSTEPDPAGDGLEPLIQVYIERLRSQQLRIEQEFFSIARGQLVSSEEMAALFASDPDDSLHDLKAGRS